MTPSEIESATFRLVTRCHKQLYHGVSPAKRSLWVKVYIKITLAYTIKLVPELCGLDSSDSVSNPVAEVTSVPVAGL
jgi:hypothetical protein